MIKKLKLRFIALAMISMFVLLTLIITTVNIVNYNSVISNADKVLKIFIHENDIDIDLDNQPEREKSSREEKEKPSKRKIPDTYMVDEYFSVLISEKGEVIATDRDTVPWMKEETATKYGLMAYEENKEIGSVAFFRYHTDTEDEGTLITLLNIDRELSACRKFMFVSLCVGFCGYIVVSMAIIFYAGRLTGPIAESYKRQKRFITDAGHELKTPLTIINANTDLLELNVGENEAIDDIRQQVQRLTDLTNDLVYLSRMEETDNNLTMTEFPVSDVIQEMLCSFRATASTQGQHFTYKVEPSLSYIGNSRAIAQLTSIIMENALKYSQKGGRIEASLKKHGKHLILTVFNTTDNAIYEENLDHLFERFYRTDTSRNSETGGYGIGLSVAKAIVTAHNGKISATTDDGYSFRITVTLPIK